MSRVDRLPANVSRMVADRGGYGEGDYGEAIDLRKILGVLRRRKVMILGIVALITSIAVLYVNQLTPLYRAKTLVVVMDTSQNVVDIDTVSQGISTDYYTNETEAAIITSRELGRRAVEKLKLMESSLFNYELRPPEPSLLSAVKHAVKVWLGDTVLDPLRTMLGQGAEIESLEGDEEIDEISPEEEEMILFEEVIDIYLDGLDAEPEERSHIIEVSYVLENPSIAAKLANTAAELYIEDQIRVKSEATAKASIWLSERVRELKEEVAEKELILEEFRHVSGIVELGDMSLYQQQLATLSKQLVEARNARSEAEARAEQIQTLLESEGGIETAAAVLDSPLIQRLREQETEVVRKISEMETQYREGYPKMMLAKNEYADLKEKIAAEVNKIIINQSNELEISAVREANLEKEVKRLESILGEQGEAEVTVRQLLSEVNASKQLYETFLERYKETDIQDEALLTADARIISKAIAPAWPFYPRKKLMIVAAMVLSLVLGLALAFLAEFLDSGFRSITQIEQLTGQSSLGMLPLVHDAKNKKPHEIAAEKPNSSYGEAVRTLRTGLMLSSVDHPPSTVAVTSAMPNEGKSTTSLAIAAATAKAGQRAIIIDCDLRSPSLNEQLEVPNGLGLGDHLAGGVPLDDVIEIEPCSGVHYMTAGSRVPNPTDLLGSESMKALLMRLEKMYDLVILDMPPLLAVSDVLVLVRVVDKIMFVVRWEKTPRDQAISAIRQLVATGADMAGVVLSQVDVSRHSQYHYADSGFYQGGYAKYYLEDG